MSAQNEQQNSLKKLAVVSSDLKKNINYNDFCAITCASFINTTTGVNIKKNCNAHINYHMLFICIISVNCFIFPFLLFRVAVSACFYVRFLVCIVKLLLLIWCFSDKLNDDDISHEDKPELSMSR